MEIMSKSAKSLLGKHQLPSNQQILQKVTGPVKTEELVGECGYLWKSHALCFSSFPHLYADLC